MCGICGVVNFDPAEVVDSRVVQRMSQLLTHRGPDDDGMFVEGQVGLGFRRLSIIDLNGGKQPIFNEDGSAAIIFNGEIYNYRDLAADLVAAGHTLKTQSDTETILHAYEEYGDDCVQHLRGMFGFAIWDRQKRRLLLARDRVGVKPVYYYRNSRFLAFASEIKSLLQIQNIPREVDTDSLGQYLSLRYVPGPRTMFKNIFRLQPGHTLVVDDRGVRIRKYWDIEYSEEAERTPKDILERFRELLEETVRLRLMSEVPLGVFLSGGLDSSAILATMSRLNRGDRIKTFSVGYEGSSAQARESNEFDYARLAARAFGTQHYECRVTPRDFEEFIPDLVWHLDEPMGDPSCVPLHFLSKMAREHVTVVLSGEGADEVLAGYGIYSRMLTVDKIRRSVPGLCRLAPWLARLTPSERLRNYVRLSGEPLEGAYHGVSRGFSDETKRRLIGKDQAGHSEQQLNEMFRVHFKAIEKASRLNQMLYVDAKVWLPDDLLLKADKMTMANGLELRVPFLDHQLIEFAATLPGHSKLGAEGGKTLLRQAMRGVLPDKIIDRPKKGFPVPISAWLRQPLRQFTRDTLLTRHSACSRYLEHRAIASVVEEHEQGRVDRSQEIWMLLVFELWHRQFVEDNAQRRQASA
jgi:asparagine synthase (glutamine-hydrolysing)